MEQRMKVRNVITNILCLVFSGFLVTLSILVFSGLFNNYDSGIKGRVVSENGEIISSFVISESRRQISESDAPAVRRFLNKGSLKSKPSVRESAEGELSLQEAIERLPTIELMEAGLIPEFTRSLERYNYSAILYDYSQTDYSSFVDSLWYIEMIVDDNPKVVDDGPLYIRYYIDSVSGDLYEVEYALPVGLRIKPAQRYSIMESTYCNIMNVMFANFCSVDITMMTKSVEIKGGYITSFYIDSSGLIKVSATEGITSEGNEQWILSLIDQVTTKKH